MFPSLRLLTVFVLSIVLAVVSQFPAVAAGDVSHAAAAGASFSNDRAARRLGWTGRLPKYEAEASDVHADGTGDAMTAATSTSASAEAARASARRMPAVASVTPAAGNRTTTGNTTAPANGTVPSGGSSSGGSPSPSPAPPPPPAWEERPVESEEEAIEEELDHFIDGPIAKSAAAVFSITAIVRRQGIDRYCCRCCALGQRCAAVAARHMLQRLWRYAVGPLLHHSAAPALSHRMLCLSPSPSPSRLPSHRPISNSISICRRCRAGR